MPQGKAFNREVETAPVVAAQTVAAEAAKPAQSPQFIRAESTPQAAAVQGANAPQDNPGQGGGQESGLNQQPNAAPAPAVSQAHTALTVAEHKSFEQMLSAQGRPVQEQIAFHMKSAMHEGSSRISIQLTPVELGKLDIELTIGADGKAGVTIMVENRQTLELLQKDTGLLQRALAEAGLKTDAGSLSFNLSGQQSQQQQSQKNRQQAKYGGLPAIDPLEEMLAQTPMRAYAMPVREGLDIQI